MKPFAKLFSVPWGQALVYSEQNEEGKASYVLRTNVMFDGVEVELQTRMTHPSNDENVSADYVDQLIERTNEDNVVDAMKKIFGEFINDNQ